MNRKQEYDFYAKAENQTPRGRGLRRDESLTEIVPVCFEADMIEEVRRRADAADESVSAWIRGAVEQALRRTTS